MHNRYRNHPAFMATPPILSTWSLYRLPGIACILAGLAVFFFAGIRSVIFHWGIPLPMRLISQLSGSIGGLLIVYGVYKFTKRFKTRRLLTANHHLKILLWYGCLLLYVGVGLLNGNSLTVMGKEFVILWLFGVFWTIGADDRFWLVVERPLTVVFYIAALFVYAYASTPGIITGEFGSEYLEMDTVGIRNIYTIGYGLRPLMGAGMFLFVWGVVNPRKGVWKYLQIAALFVSFFFSVGIFIFRGAAFSLAALALIVLLVRPLLEKRRRPGITAFLVAAGIIGMFLFSQTRAFEFLVQRTLVHTQDDALFGSRTTELQAYLADMGWSVMWGRGLGGTFDASSTLDVDARYHWGTLHYGFLVFTLKGGLPMAAIFLAVLTAGLKLRPRHWYQNPMNLTAALMFPILALNFFVNPFYLTPDAIFTYLPSMIVLSRFGRRVEIDMPNPPRNTLCHTNIRLQGASQ